MARKCRTRELPIRFGDLAWQNNGIVRTDHSARQLQERVRQPILGPLIHLAGRNGATLLRGIASTETVRLIKSQLKHMRAVIGPSAKNLTRCGDRSMGFQASERNSLCAQRREGATRHLLHQPINHRMVVIPVFQHTLCGFNAGKETTLNRSCRLICLQRDNLIVHHDRRKRWAACDGMAPQGPGNLIHIVLSSCQNR